MNPDLRTKSIAELARIANRELGLTHADIDATVGSAHKKASWIQAIIRGRADKRFKERPTVKPLPVIKTIQTYPKQGNHE